MTQTQYQRAQALIATAVGINIALAIAKNNFLIALVGVIVGMIAVRIIYQKSKQLADERILTVLEKASRYAYSISSVVLGITSFLLVMWGRQGNEKIFYTGTVLAYATCLLIGIYSVAFYFLNKKYGAEDDQ
jgi:uncharacterized membrane protein